MGFHLGTGVPLRTSFSDSMVNQGLPPQVPQLGAPYVVGDEADDDHRWPVFVGESLGAKDDLVEAVAGYTAVQYPAAAETLKLRRPGLRVAHLFPKGVGIAHGENHSIKVGIRRLAARPQAIAVDCHDPTASANPAEPRFRCVPQPIIVHQAKIVRHERETRPRHLLQSWRQLSIWFRRLGWVAERFKAPVLKTGVGSRPPWVRIPPPPPSSFICPFFSVTYAPDCLTAKAG